MWAVLPRLALHGGIVLPVLSAAAGYDHAPMRACAALLALAGCAGHFGVRVRFDEAADAEAATQLEVALVPASPPRTRRPSLPA